MTTGWDAPPDPAPAIAYRLTAAVADGDLEGAGFLWGELDPPGRARVIAALGAQARNAAWDIGYPAGTTPELLAGQVVDLIADLLHCQARPAALNAIAGRPDAMLPPCDGCPRPAVALAAARVRILQMIGFSPASIAEISRRAAGRPRSR